MKMKPFAVQTMLAVSLLAGGSTLALATGGERCDEGDKTCLPRLMEKLDLNPTQQKQIRNFLTQQRGELQEQHRALRDVRRKLYNAANRDDYDAVQVKQLIEQQSRLSADMARKRADMMKKIYRQITPRQQAKFQLMHHRYYRG